MFVVCVVVASVALAPALLFDCRVCVLFSAFDVCVCVAQLAPNLRWVVEASASCHRSLCMHVFVCVMVIAIVIVRSSSYVVDLRHKPVTSIESFLASGS